MKALVILIMGVMVLASCSPKPQPISRGYKNPQPKHITPPRTMSGPNSGNYYKR